MEEIRAHAVQLLKMCVNLKKRIVTLANFTSNKDIALYSRSCSSAVFMAMYIIFIWKKVGGNNWFWSSTSSDVGLIIMNHTPNLVLGELWAGLEDWTLSGILPSHGSCGFAEWHLNHLHKMSHLLYTGSWFRRSTLCIWCLGSWTSGHFESSGWKHASNTCVL